MNYWKADLALIFILGHSEIIKKGYILIIVNLNASFYKT
jgi:hypothetical protein